MCFTHITGVERMCKRLILLIFLSFLGLTACHDSERGIDYIYDGYGYFGDELAGRDFAVTDVELGIGSGNFYEVDPSNLVLSFDFYAGSITGSKNCNSFNADSNWYEFGVIIDVFFYSNNLCGFDPLEFPEDVLISDAFEIEMSFELGRQILILYSESQDVAIYLREF